MIQSKREKKEREREKLMEGGSCITLRYYNLPGPSWRSKAEEREREKERGRKKEREREKER